MSDKPLPRPEPGLRCADYTQRARARIHTRANGAMSPPDARDRAIMDLSYAIDDLAAQYANLTEGQR